MKKVSGFEQFKRVFVSQAIEKAARAASGAAAMTPLGNMEKHGIERLRDIPYITDENGGAITEHLLDVWRPKDRSGPLPVLMYVHGGGFRILSKDVHWMFGLEFAKLGFVVFNINYRLVPKHGFPDGLTDVMAAYRWVLDNAEAYGGDVDRLVLAGESAGANLSLATTLSMCRRYDDVPFAAGMADVPVLPKVVIPYCGILEVRNIERLITPEVPGWIAARMRSVSEMYATLADAAPAAHARLADPLVELETHTDWHRPLPPMFSTVGSKDPLVDDTARLEKAMQALGRPAETHVVPGGIHAFQAMTFQAAAQTSWDLTRAYLHKAGLGLPGATA